MNTHAEYRRHRHQPETRAAEPTDAAVNILAVHHDPSLAFARGPATPTGRRIAWIRPTELHAYAGSVVGRGIDLHTELARRARQAPPRATRAARRHLIPTLERRSPVPPASQEGLQL
jgi:hypothetical protein